MWVPAPFAKGGREPTASGGICDRINKEKTMTTIPVITIDGPGGTGKGTVGQRLAKELGWHYLDSGALYRLLALAAEKHQTALDDEQALAHLAQHLLAKFDTTHNVGQLPQVSLEGIDVTDVIRGESYGSMASKVAALPLVRQALLERQWAFRKSPGLVTDGRDMGSVIFPDAELKIFLLASPQERARRRHEQLKARGINVSLATLCDELIERDERDQQRKVAPLIPAHDAIIVDTTHLDIDEVLQRIRIEVQRVFASI